MSTVIFEGVNTSKSIFKKSHQNFWGEYERYANLQEPTPTLIKNYQISRVAAFSNRAIQERASKLTEQVNQMLFDKEISANYLNEEKENTIQKAMENILNNVYNITINTTKKNIIKEGKENDVEKSLINIQESLETINRLLGENNTIDGKYINDFMEKMKSYNNNKNSEDLLSLIQTRYQLQGKILEDMGTAVLNKWIPKVSEGKNIKAINIGAVLGENKKMLGTDIIIADLDNALEFQVALGEEIKTMTFRELDKAIQNKKTSIQIVDEAMALGNTLLNIQAKSGRKQIPYNITSSKISLNQINGQYNNSLANQYKRFLDHMLKLRNGITISGKQLDDKYKNQILQKSNIYSLMGDYILGGGLDKVLKLGANKNQYLLTYKGFMSYEERIKELFNQELDTNKYPFHFKPPVSLVDGYADKVRTVAFSRQ